MEYILNESTAPHFKEFGIAVFNVDPNLDVMNGAKEAIKELSNFFVDTLGLDSTLSALGIDDTHFEAMARSACGGSTLKGFRELSQDDVVAIYKMCL